MRLPVRTQLRVDREPWGLLDHSTACAALLPAGLCQWPSWTGAAAALLRLHFPIELVAFSLRRACLSRRGAARRSVIRGEM